jgi:hypothetical protein
MTGPGARRPSWHHAVELHDITRALNRASEGMLASLASLCDHELSVEEHDAHMGRLLLDLADVRLALDRFSIEGTPIVDRLRTAR